MTAERDKKKKSNENMIAESAAPAQIYYEDFASGYEEKTDGEKKGKSAGVQKFPAKGKNRKYTGNDPFFGEKAAHDFAAGKISSFSAAKTEKEDNKQKYPQAGHRERLRTRYLQAGAGGMTDYDLLELLLTYSIPRRDVKIPARKLLEKFKSLANIIDADVEALSSIPGISRNSAILFRIHKDLCCRYLKEEMMRENVLNSITAVEKYVRMNLSGYKEEVMMAIYLNVHNYVIESSIVARGTIDRAAVYPRNIAEEALLKKAASVICVHNHPGGEVMPSDEDIHFTRMVRSTLLPLEITLLDHLIVCRDSVFSFHNSLPEVLTADEEEFRKGF